MPSTPDPSRTASPTQPHPHLEVSGKLVKKIHPYICFGFKINESVVYLSDASHIPDDTWPILESPSLTLPVFILDCLGLTTHTSHFGIVDSIAVARRVSARRTYLTGFSHRVSHDEYVTLGEVVGGRSIEDPTQLTSREQEGFGMIEEGKKVWLRPGHDGLRVFISQDGDVRDETYD